MKILVVGDPHGSEKIKRIPVKKVDLILIPGDIGKADLARKNYFRKIERDKKGLPEIPESKKEVKAKVKEIYDSTIRIAKHLSKVAPVCSILGNVGETMLDKQKMEREEKKFGVIFPRLGTALKKIKNFNLVRNKIRIIKGLRIGFLEYFIEDFWVSSFDPKNKDLKKSSKKQTAKAKKILERFGRVDILVCHQPPYGILDKVTAKYAPKHWKGKHAGSKTILKYIKKFQPRYVVCGHIHEGKGKKRLGKTTIINTGHSGDYFILNLG